MATVNGMTAEAMQAILDQLVETAEVNEDGDLILSLYGGGTTNAGSVIGPQGDPGDPGDPGTPGATGPSGLTVCTSGTRPGSPTNGQMIFETDTFRTLQYYTVLGGWYPIWNTSWGRIAQVNDVGSAFATLTPTQVSLSNVPLMASRLYVAKFQVRYRASDADMIADWGIEIDEGSGYTTLNSFRTTNALASGVNSSESHEWNEDFTVAATGTPDFRVVGSRITSVGTITPGLANLAIYDVGPA